MFVPSSACAAALLGGRHTNRRLPFIRPFYIRDALLLGAQSICLHISKRQGGGGGGGGRGDRDTLSGRRWRWRERAGGEKREKTDKSGREIRGTVELEEQSSGVANGTVK